MDDKRSVALSPEPFGMKNTSTQGGRFCFRDFFKKGSGGRTIFNEYVVPFLSLDDLVNGAATCRQMNTMCRTYTIGDILSLRSITDVSREHQEGLGKFIIGALRSSYAPLLELHHRGSQRNVLEEPWSESEDSIPFDPVLEAYYNDMPDPPPVVLPEMEELDSLMRLFHPSEIPEILSATDVYFKYQGIELDVGAADEEVHQDTKQAFDPSTPLLISATFGRQNVNGVDVTMILRYLLMKQGNTRLVLKQPLFGHRWWYTCLFGDPHPRQTKDLCIVMLLEDGATKTLTVRENDEVHVNLRAGAPEELSTHS